MKRSLCITAVLFLLALVPVTGVATDWLLSVEANDFWVDAKDGWWSDVLILTDGSGPSDVLKRLQPDVANWAFSNLSSFFVLGVFCILMYGENKGSKVR